MDGLSWIEIANDSDKDVFLWPNDEKLRNHWGVLIKSGHFVIFETQNDKFKIDIDDCFFQFEGMKRKIKPKNIEKYNVTVDVIRKSM